MLSQNIPMMSWRPIITVSDITRRSWDGFRLLGKGLYRLDAFEDFDEVVGVHVPRHDPQCGDAARTNKLCGDCEQTVSHTLKGHTLPARRTAQLLEPVEKVVGEKDQLEEGLVGNEVLYRYLAQCIGVFHFPDDKFCGGAWTPAAS
jgi:hypothetical protein